MTPSKPYLIRGLYEWLLDNEVTPFILVDADYPQVMIPKGVASNGKVVLNLAPRAIQDLEMTNEYLSFSARFNGVAENIYCPMGSVLAIYSRENGEGMMFNSEEAGEAGTGESDKKPEKPGLKVIK